MALTIAGFVLSFGMGMTLGLLGAGGSILTVPILVYFFNIAPLKATTYSLLIVGLAASAGALNYWTRQLVSFKSAFIFAIPSMCSVFLARSYLIPILPDPMFRLGHVQVGKNEAVMLLFALLMCLSAYFMFRNGSKERPLRPQQQANPMQLLLLAFYSAGIGLLTGAIGAGGGFLIMPALIEFFRLPFKLAVGTSLTIIAINSLVGFNSDLLNGPSIDWSLLLMLLATTLTGMLTGTYLSKKMDATALRRLFAVFVLVVGVVVLAEQVFIIGHKG